MTPKKISWYTGNIRDSRCHGSIGLNQLVKRIKNPTDQVKLLIEQIREATKSGDSERKAMLKEQLYCFTPCAWIPEGKTRKYENIGGFTGMAHLDFDKIDYAPALKEWLFKDNDFIICAFISPSGRGVKALARIPVVNSVDEYKEHFLSLEQYFEDLGIDCFDHAPYNAILPLFLSFDSKILYRREPALYAGKLPLNDVSSYENLSKSRPEYTIPEGDRYGTAGYYKKITIDIFLRKIDEITSEPGHPRMRDACLVLGSRAGAGYLTKAEAESIASRAIQANSYLSRKGKYGLETYIRTSIWAINRGYQNPKHYS